MNSVIHTGHLFYCNCSTVTVNIYPIAKVIKKAAWNSMGRLDLLAKKALPARLLWQRSHSLLHWLKLISVVSLKKTDASILSVTWFQRTKRANISLNSDTANAGTPSPRGREIRRQRNHSHTRKHRTWLGVSKIWATCPFETKTKSWSGSPGFLVALEWVTIARYVLVYQQLKSDFIYSKTDTEEAFAFDSEPL